MMVYLLVAIITTKAGLCSTDIDMRVRAFKTREACQVALNDTRADQKECILTRVE